VGLPPIDQCHIDLDHAGGNPAVVVGVRYVMCRGVMISSVSRTPSPRSSRLGEEQAVQEIYGH
jgi:hypothetical protein